MKLIVITILTVTLAGGVMFGLATMSHSEHMVNCFASLAQGVFCPQFASLLDLVAFHFNVLGNLSSAVFGSMIFAIAGFVVLFFAKHFYISPPAVNFARQRIFNIKNFSQCRARMTRWLSLFEKRDPRATR